MSCLSAQSAYLIAMYRHRPVMIEKLRKMILDHASAFRGRRGFIGCGASVVNSGIITNVIIGESASIEGGFSA